MTTPILPVHIFLVELESYELFRKNNEKILLDWLQIIIPKDEDWFVLFSIKLSYISRNDKFYKKILDKIKNKIAAQSKIQFDKECKNFLLVPDSGESLTQKESLLFQYYWNVSFFFSRGSVLSYIFFFLDLVKVVSGKASIWCL
jgi:hypothetical protein